MTTDEQRARELADLLHTAYEAELEHEHGIEHMAALLLPLIRDQGRYQWLRDESAKATRKTPTVIDHLPMDLEDSMLSGIGLDAAIDKARLTSPPPSQAAIPTTGD